MLQRMVKMVSAPAAFGVHGCDGGHGLIAVSQLLRGSRRIPTNERNPIVLGAQIVKWRPVVRPTERQVFHLKGQSIWTYNFSHSPGSFSQHAFNKLNNVAGPSSSRGSIGNILSEGGLDVAPAKHLSTAESSSKNFSLRKPLAAINYELLVKSVIYEAQRGCINVPGKTKRFCDFLLEQVTAQAAFDHLGANLETRKLFWSLAQDTRRYDQMEKIQRMSLLDKVAQSLGFNSLQELIAHDTAAMEASQGLQFMTPEKDVQGSENSSLSTSPESGGVSEKKETRVQGGGKGQVFLRQVPGIKYGRSEPIKLPDQVVKSNSASISVADPEVSKSSVTVPRKRRKIDPEVSESSKSGLRKGKKVDSEISEGFRSVLGTGTEFAEVKKAQKSAVRSGVNVKVASMSKYDLSTFRHTTDIQEFASSRASVIDEKFGLDLPISSIKTLSAPHRIRLEENGFNTMRQLLQHFPRMYQNFRQAGQRVEDGQNLSFVGVILQSRGSLRGFSLGLVEVIVRSEVDEVSGDDPMSGIEEGLQNGDSFRMKTGRTVFLHLKRFFKGSRYANPWFLNAIANKYPENAQVTVCGKVKEMPQCDHFEIREFNIELWDGANREEPGLVSAPELLSGGKPYPVYPGKGSLQPRTIEFCIQRVLPLLSAELDPLPRGLQEKFQIHELHEAYRGIHSPMQAKDAEVARRRLVFDEFFYLQLGMLLPRQGLADSCGPGAGMPDLAAVFKGGILDMEKWSPLTMKLLKFLPYNLTESQIKAAGEVIWDLRRPFPMNRLLQGDVGCGKTIVAFLALIEVIDAGYQGALMAPTEFLAIQHYQRITSWLEKLEEGERPRVALLTGSTTLSKARVIRSVRLVDILHQYKHTQGFESGEIALAVGTHSLISDSVKFSALKLAVIDEQHRFGVSQRGRLNTKARDAVQTPDSEITGDENDPKSITVGAPHILAMSATPIPRTLALAMHGDMSLSQITELPPGRAETATYAIHGDKKGRQEVYKRVRKELEGGGRVFVVFPVIEESEEIPDVRAAETEFKSLELDFQEFKFGLVHGRMRSHEKDEEMERFKAGDTQVLVSTTVIEVGIDIPEASMIVIEHAERYGMAQLHQLRGRVGRGSRASSCILLGSRQSSLARLKLLETSRDGFYLAEVDLQQRGPGDMLGKRQSGYLPEFNIARIEQDGVILEHARNAAEELLHRHPMLRDLPRIRHELSMRRPPASLA